MSERGSNPHAPRVDDQIAKETSGLVHGAPDEGRTEGRRHEDVAPPGRTSAVDRHDVGSSGPGLDEATLDLRARMAAHLASADFPATTEELREVGQAEFAPEDVMQALAELPGGETYAAIGDVWRAIGGPTEHRPEEASGVERR